MCYWSERRPLLERKSNGLRSSGSCRKDLSYIDDSLWRAARLSDAKSKPSLPLPMPPFQLKLNRKYYWYTITFTI